MVAGRTKFVSTGASLGLQIVRNSLSLGRSHENNKFVKKITETYKAILQ